MILKLLPESKLKLLLPENKLKLLQRKVLRRVAKRNKPFIGVVIESVVRDLSC